MITQHRDGDVTVIEIDRHERRNALDTAHCHDLREALTGEALTEETLTQEALTGPGSARAIVITGTVFSFCAWRRPAGRL